MEYNSRTVPQIPSCATVLVYRSSRFQPSNANLQSHMMNSLVGTNRLLLLRLSLASHSPPQHLDHQQLTQEPFYYLRSSTSTVAASANPLCKHQALLWLYKNDVNHKVKQVVRIGADGRGFHKALSAPSARGRTSSRITYKYRDQKRQIGRKKSTIWRRDYVATSRKNKSVGSHAQKHLMELRDQITNLKH